MSRRATWRGPWWAGHGRVETKIRRVNNSCQLDDGFQFPGAPGASLAERVLCLALWHDLLHGMLDGRNSRGSSIHPSHSSDKGKGNMDSLTRGLWLLSHLKYLRYLRYLQYLEYIALLHQHKPSSSRGIKSSSRGTINGTRPLSAQQRPSTQLAVLIKLANILKRLYASPLVKILTRSSPLRKILAHPHLRETLRHLSKRLIHRVGNRRT